MTARQMVRAVLAQARIEILMTLRRGESVLVTLIIPAGLLVFFASTRLLPGTGGKIGPLLASTLVTAIIATGLVSLGIATAYERYYNVLKYVGVTPFSRLGLVVAKILAVIALEVIQVVVLAGIAALLYGWRPHGSPLLAGAALLAGTSAFAGLGLLMAGRLRAEATLAGANALFLFFVLLGGVYVQTSHLPAALAALAQLLPAWALVQVLRALLAGTAVSGQSLAALLAWAVAMPLLAARLFRWE